MSAGCLKWQTHCQHCPQKHQYPASLLFDRSYRNFALKRDYFTKLQRLTIVTPSTWLAARVKESFLGHKTCVTIHNGIDIEVFRPLPGVQPLLPELAEKRMILCVASPWTERKGLKVIYQLAKELRDGEVLVAVGLNRFQLKRKAANLIGLPPIRDPSQLARWYSAASVFFNPSLEETFPTVNLEAQSCGTPVVTFDNGGCAETISRSTGTAVKTNDLPGAISAIRQFLDSTPESNRIACRKFVEDQFDRLKQFSKYLCLYETCLAER
jgi:glycosyltransferase involved in cell wall biosynthesis